MILSKRFQSFILFLGDCALLYLGLFSALVLRYHFPVPPKIWQLHFTPFSIIFGLWLIILYIAGGYDLLIFASLKKGFGQIAKIMLVAGFAAILIFYLVPFFKITPKTNLAVVAGLSAFLLLFWRRFFWDIASRSSKINVLFFGYSKEVRELALALKSHPHLGYEPALIMVSPINPGFQKQVQENREEIPQAPLNHNLAEVIKKYDIQLIAASKNIMQDKNAAKRFYQVLPLGITMADFTDFYENIMEKVPVSMITETWFLENLLEINKRIFEFFKRVFDIIFAVILGLLAIVFIFSLFALLIKSESRGPVFIRQKRVGKNGQTIEIIKLRSMVKDAEKNGAQWAKEKDERITRIGKFIRKTRIDELSQVWNVLKGDLSFIGPRPERPEFVETLQEQIPYYAMRHLVKPGLSGWAQIRLPHGGVGEAAMEKLQFDLFYIKNRSFVLDLAIALKTLAAILKFEGR